MLNREMMKEEVIEEQLDRFVNKGQSAKFGFGTISLILLSVLIIIISTFTQFSFTHPVIPQDLLSNWCNYFTAEGINWNGFVKYYKYIPQIPAIFFILSLLNRKYTLITVFIYLILGLVGYPIFALGGGWQYIFQYGFYYLIGYIPAVFFAGTILNKNYSLLNILKAITVGVIIIHLIGCLGMIFIATLKNESGVSIRGWILTMSGLKIIYDIIFSVIAVYLGHLTKKILWFIMN